MEQVKIKDSILSYYDTPWNFKSLKVSSNEIDSITYNSNDELSMLIASFEQKSVNQKIKVSTIRTDNRVIITELEKQGYKKKELSLSVLLSIRKKEAFETRGKITLSNDIGLLENDIMKMAYEEFHYGRFLEDTDIEEEKTRLRTKYWIDDLIKQTNVECIIGLSKNNHFVGFMFYKINGGTIEFILGGCTSRFQHLSLEFWKTIINKFISTNQYIDIKTIISAANPNIINLYSNLGFMFTKSLFGLHKHRNY